MKNWKALIAGFLVLCLTILSVPYGLVRAEDGEEEQETEEPIPDSYYYEIESNKIPLWPQGPSIESASAAVMDMDTGTFLYSKNATATMYPASVTKIMTTLLLVENCDLDDEITFSEIVYDLEEGSSHLGIQPGEKMKLRDAAYGIMLASANDISNGVAEYVGGSISGFADMMNARAEEIGCVNTHFANPHGLYQEDHYTCAHDMALIAQAAYQNPVFKEIATTTEHTIPKTNLVEEERSFLNHQKMMLRDEEYYRDYCTGGKTGFTSQCLNTLVTFAEKDGKSLVSVVFRVNGAGKAYNESAQILEYGLENFNTKKFEAEASKRTFYDIMGLGYLGEASKFQLSAGKQVPVSGCSGSITLPNTATESDVTYEVMAEDGNQKTLSYKYNGVSVGSFQGSFNTAFVPAQTLLQKKTDLVEETIEEASGANIQVESLNEVLNQAAGFFQTGYRMFKEYTEKNTMTVVISGIVILLLLILFIVLLIFRSTSESRIKRRRRQEEEERRKREEEIERMTTAEIEAELRAVMEQERLHREQEELARAEAERAAEEARIMDEKAHETERLLDELERERQERLAEKDKG